MMTMMEKLKMGDFKIDSDDSIIRQMKEALYACPNVLKLCKQMGMTDQVIDDNVIKIYEYVRDVNYCRKCPGLKMCKKENAYLNTTFTYSNNIVETQLVPCKELLKRVSFERQFQVKDFPDEWLDDRVADYNDWLKPDEKKNPNNPIVRAMNDLKLYELNKETRWVYMRGGNKTGKSRLAATMVIDLAKKEIKGKVPVCFIDFSKRVRELNDLSRKNQDEFKKKLDLYSTVPVLVIDGFGQEFRSDFIRDAIVNEIISSRSNKQLFTIFTSNFSLREIEVLYACNNEAGAIMSKQMVKTIKAMCTKEIEFGDIPLFE